MGEGDCDSDDECAGDLVCGLDNCIYFDSAWPNSFDCCTKGKNITQLLQAWFLMAVKIIQFKFNDTLLHQFLEML